MTRPKPTPRLYGEAAKRFEEIDKIPLTDEQIKFLAECLLLYVSNPIRVSPKEREGEK
jgi:hypothetical protein